MRYGFGSFLLVAGLALALAVRDSVSSIDLAAAGWIMALVGLPVLVLTAATLNRGRRARTVQTITHPDGS